MPKRRRGRVRAVPAGDIIVGDLLWSSATERPLRVIACAREMVDPSGNLSLVRDNAFDDEREPDKPRVPAIVLSVMGPAGDLQRLGAFAPHAKIQVQR